MPTSMENSPPGYTRQIISSSTMSYTAETNYPGVRDLFR
jgi:hypothetical protein